MASAALGARCDAVGQGGGGAGVAERWGGGTAKAEARAGVPSAPALLGGGEEQWCGREKGGPRGILGALIASEKAREMGKESLARWRSPGPEAVKAWVALARGRWQRRREQQLWAPTLTRTRAGAWLGPVGRGRARRGRAWRRGQGKKGLARARAGEVTRRGAVALKSTGAVGVAQVDDAGSWGSRATTGAGDARRGPAATCMTRLTRVA